MAENRLIGDYPVIGIRPTIDGRRGALGVRESLEEQTMNMAKSAAKLFEEKELVCYDGKMLWHILDKAGADARKISFLDLMMYEYVLNPGSGNAGISSLLSMFVGKTVPKDTVSTPFMLELEEKLRAKIEEDGLGKVLFGIELPLIGVLAKIEKNLSKRYCKK